MWGFGNQGGDGGAGSTLGTMLRMMGMGDVVPLIESGDFAENIRAFVDGLRQLDARTTRCETMLMELLRRDDNRTAAAEAGTDNGSVGAGTAPTASEHPVARTHAVTRRAGNGAAPAPAAPQ